VKLVNLLYFSIMFSMCTCFFLIGNMTCLRFYNRHELNLCPVVTPYRYIYPYSSSFSFPSFLTLVSLSIILYSFSFSTQFETTSPTHPIHPPHPLPPRSNSGDHLASLVTKSRTDSSANENWVRTV
jgi:hypothetical protein